MHTDAAIVPGTFPKERTTHCLLLNTSLRSLQAVRCKKSSVELIQMGTYKKVPLIAGPRTCTFIIIV